MKCFLRKVFLFLLPVVIPIALIEVFFRFYDNSYRENESFINANQGEIEILLLGSSHSQAAVNPNVFAGKLLNLSYGGQDYFLDSALLVTYCYKLNKLKAVLIEVDYHSLEHGNPTVYWRNPLYNRYHDLELPTQGLINSFLMIASNKSFFVGRLLGKLRVGEFATVSKFETLDYDSARILETSRNRLLHRHKERSDFFFNRNVNLLKSMIRVCHERNIQVFLISMPVYESYIVNKLIEKDKKRRELITQLLAEIPYLTYLDYENTPLVQKAIYFDDDDHLNIQGSKLFSEALKKDLSLISAR